MRIGVVISGWIPSPVEELGLVVDAAPLYVHVINEVVVHVWPPPISAPDQVVGLRQMTEEIEASLPTRLAADVLDKVAGKTVLVDSDPSQLSRALVEELFLTLLASVGLENHEIYPMSLRIIHDAKNLSPHVWLQEFKVGNYRGGIKAIVGFDVVSVEVGHFKICTLVSPMKKATEDITHY